MKIKNISQGPKSFHVKDGGQVLIEAGQTMEVDLADGVEKTKVFKAMIDEHQIRVTGGRSADDDEEADAEKEKAATMKRETVKK